MTGLFTIRRAAMEDLEALSALEERCFDLDRLSRRNFRYLLGKARAVTLVAEKEKQLAGYSMVLFNAGTSLARLYSIAVDPPHRGTGLGRILLESAEEEARNHDCVTMRLEVRPDNARGIALYERLGYRQFDVVEDYYEDHRPAYRFEKKLAPHAGPEPSRVPFYEQTLDFTCGPSALMMAMKALRPGMRLDRKLELRIWRESTSIFMMSGHGGCGPYGLALSAYHRGFGVDLVLNDEGALFVDSVRSADKKDVIRLVQEDMLEEIRRLPIRLSYAPVTLELIQERFEQGQIPVVLISSYRIYHEKIPHWVTVTGMDERFVFAHDSYVGRSIDSSPTDRMNMPVPKKDFERMARYGKAGLRAALFLFPRSAPPAKKEAG
ncbi:MAG: peptidase C39 family protein [Acidobacteriota bacterium]